MYNLEQATGNRQQATGNRQQATGNRQQASIIFFMLVTNRDTYLASYAIRSYQKLINGLNNFSWKLVVYMNNLKEEFKIYAENKWKKFDYVEIVDNTKFINIDELVPGNIVKSDEGWTKLIEGKYEPCGVVWTREFRNFQSDYWVTVDADFEILSPQFVIEAFEKMENTKNIVAISSNYSDNCHVYDSYSNENIIAMKRYHTWFCIYKKQAQKCKASHFYYQEIVHGLRLSFDEGAKFQWDLREQFGYEMESVDKRFQSQFIHYGAFSKNNSLDTEKKIYFYRIIAILSHRGLMGGNNIIDKIIRKIFKFIHRAVYNKISDERRKNNYHSKLDN
jgi:hypothetical protein